jgi:hypothetical protein
VRALSVAGYVPRQHIFFVPHDVTALAGTRIRRWTLTLEFADTVGQSVTGREKWCQFVNDIAMSLTN